MDKLLLLLVSVWLLAGLCESSCVISHNAYGDFKFPTTGTWTGCTLTLNTWAGVSVASSNTINNFAGGLATRVNLGNRAFVYGLSYSFSFGANCGDCSSTTVSKTPTLCSDGSGNASYMAPVVKPQQKMSIVVQRPPSGTFCYHIITDSSATGTRTSPTAVDCNFAPLLAWPSATAGKTWYVNMVRYSSAPTLLSDEPTCGVSEVVIPTPACSGSLSYSLASWSSIKVALSTYPSATYKCVFTLTKWASAINNVSIRKVSPDCTSVVFSVMDTGIAYSNTANFYAAEYYMYANDKDLNSDNPDCVTIATDSGSVLRPDATSLVLADLTVTRPDPKTVRVTIVSTKAYPFGTCEVRLSASTSAVGDIPSTPISRFGPCSGNFDFTIDGVTINAWTGSKIQSFVYLFYPEGDISGTVVGPSTVKDYTIPTTAFSLPALTYTENPSGTYLFDAGSPTPLVGGCALYFQDASSAEGYIPWPGCGRIEINYYDMKLAKSTIGLPGTSFNFKTYYYYGGYSSGATADATSAALSLTIRINYGLVLSSATATSITVKLGSPTSPPTGVANNFANIDTVTVGFYGCNTASPLPLVTSGSILTPFTDGTTFSDGVSGVTIPTGGMCVFDVKIKTTTDANGVYSGYSGYVTFVAAGAPSWSGVALPRVMLYGSDCVRLVWTKVADPVNAPVTCYLVLAASSTTSAGATTATATVVRTCSDSRALVADHTYCSLTSSLYYVFSINAVNMQGANSISTSVFKLSDLQADQTLTYSVTVDSNSNKFAAGTFPILSISWAPSVAPTNLMMTRLLVGVLMNLATLDTDTKTVPVYTVSSGQYTGPLSSNQAFPFVDTYSYRITATPTYMYDLIIPPGTVTKAGQYSVVTYALQGGGLRAQYWANVALSGTVKKEQVDSELNFSWGTGSVFSYGTSPTITQVYDLLSVRWTGFIEAAFSELYTFYMETNARVMMWIDNVPVISKWTIQGACAGECTGQYQLVQSVLTSTSNVGERKFHHLRIDLILARGSNAATPAIAKLQWSSASQTKEIIPSNRLFVGYPIYGTAAPSQYTLPTVDIEAGTVDSNAIAVSVTSTEVVAQDTFYVNITTKDVYGNIVPTANEQFSVTQEMTAQTTATDYAIATPGSLGEYFVPIQWSYPGALTVKVYRSATLLATIPVTITTGPVTQLAIGTPPTITAGVDFDLTFTLKDVGSNAVTITSIMDLTPIAITATWTGDSTLSLVTPDDTAARIQRYSTTFNPTSVTPSIGTSTVTATMNLPFKGSYSISFVFGDNTPTTSTLTVLAKTDSVSGEYSVVTTASFPPSQLLTQELYYVHVRLRDVYMNPITTTYGPSPPTFVAKIGTYAGSCAEDATDSYSFKCSWTPTVVGTNLPLYITVNGKHVSYIEDGATIQRISGPWFVNVLAGSYSPGSSLVLGLQKVYMVGVSNDLTIVLRDSSTNLVGAAPATCPAVQVTVTGTATTIYNLSPVCNNDGTISAVFTPTKYESSATLSMTVSNTAVTVSPTAVSVQAGLTSTSASSCAVTTTSPMTVGTSVSVTCTPYDVGSNTPIDHGYTLYAAMYMRKQLSTSVISSTLALAAGTYSASSGLAPTASGAYDYYIELAQPGGLIAKYFEYDDFTQVLGTPSGVVTAAQFSGDTELRYTRIDPSINFDWTSEGISISSTNVESIEWSGYIYFPATTVSCTLAGNGYVEFKLNDGAVIDYTNFGATTAEFTPAAFTTIAASTRYKMRLRYKPPASGSKTLSLKYTVSFGATPTVLSWIVPPMYLSAPLPVSTISGASTPITFTAGLISQTTTLFTYQPNIIKGQQATFYFYPKDVYGNALTASACTSITFSLLDASGTAVPDATAFATLPGDNTVTCPGGLSAYGSSTGFFGYLTINIEATDYSIVASVAATGVTTFTYTVNDIDITNPS